MTQSTTSKRRINPETKRLILTRIVQGVRYIDIAEETLVSVSGIKKIKKRSEALLEDIRRQQIKKEAAIVSRILQKSNKLIEHRLDRAFAGQESIPSKDLVSISKEAHRQLQTEVPNPEAPVSISKEDAIAKNALLKALEAHDEVALVKLLFESDT